MPLAFDSIPTPDYVRRYFHGFDYFNTFDPSKCGNCGYLMFMGCLFKNRYCPDDNVGMFRQRLRIYMEDKGADYFRALMEPAFFQDKLNSVYDPSKPAGFYDGFEAGNSTLRRGHWCTSTILEVLTVLPSKSKQNKSINVIAMKKPTVRCNSKYI